MTPRPPLVTLPRFLGLLAWLAVSGCEPAGETVAPRHAGPNFPGGTQSRVPGVPGSAAPAAAAGSWRTATQTGGFSSHRTAADAALGVSDEFGRRDAVCAAVRAWASDDLEGAVAWVETLPDALRPSAWQTLGPGLAARDFPRALALSADFPVGAARDDYVRLIAQSWAHAGGNSRVVERWARGISDNALREKVLGGVAVELAQTSPAEAAELVSTAFALGPEQDAAAVTVAARWAALDPGAAVGWAAEQAPGPGRDALLGVILRRWLASDATGAAAWVSSLPGDSLREVAVNCYVNAWSDSDPAGALDWAVANGREPQIAEITRRWFATRPEAARAWVAAAPLPPDTKYHLIYDDPR